MGDGCLPFRSEHGLGARWVNRQSAGRASTERFGEGKRCCQAEFAGDGAACHGGYIFELHLPIGGDVRDRSQRVECGSDGERRMRCGDDAGPGACLRRDRNDGTTGQSKSCHGVRFGRYEYRPESSCQTVRTNGDAGLFATVRDRACDRLRSGGRNAALGQGKEPR